MLRHTTLCAFVVFIMMMGAAYAQRSGDGLNPSEEPVCNPLRNSPAFGLCNAYCEAKDCDSPNPKGSEYSCTQILYNFGKVTNVPMPCGALEPAAEPPPGPGPGPGPQLGSCPCSFDVAFWTIDNLSPLLADINLSSDIICSILPSDPNFSSLKFVQVLLNRLGTFEEDGMFFIVSHPSSSMGGRCTAEGSFKSETIMITGGSELPVTSEQFPLCASDIDALQARFLTLCGQ